MGEGVGTAPHQAERAQPGRVPGVERLEAGIDRLSALEVQDSGRWPLAVVGRVQIGDRARDPHLAGPLARQQPSCGRCRVGGRLGLADRRREGDLGDAVGAFNQRPVVTRGGREDGEDRSAHAACAHPRKIEMAVRTAGRQAGVVVPGQRIIVAVKYRQHEVRR